MSRCVAVALRIRPVADQGEECLTRVTDGKDQIVHQQGVDFRFGHVLEQSTTQTELYKSACVEFIDAAMQGYHTTVFAYGQTGSGKTHTMGMDGSDGLISHSIRDIFKRLEVRPGSHEVKASFVQIYCEELQDLLRPCHNMRHMSQSRCQIRGGE